MWKGFLQNASFGFPVAYVFHNNFQLLYLTGTLYGTDCAIPWGMFSPDKVYAVLSCMFSRQGAASVIMQAINFAPVNETKDDGHVHDKV